MVAISPRKLSPTIPVQASRRGCPILYVPAQRAPAKTEALLPSRLMGGEEKGLLQQFLMLGSRQPSIVYYLVLTAINKLL